MSQDEKDERLPPGIRVRDHKTRKHGVKADRYFFIRHMVDGKQVEEGVGWASDGWTQRRVVSLLAGFAEAKRTGIGPISLKKMREAEEAAAKALKAAAEEVERAAAAAAEADENRRRQEKTMADLWEMYARDVIAVENRGRTVVDKYRIWTKRISPAIGHIKVKDVTELDVKSLVHAPFKLDKSGQVIGGKAEGGNIYRLLHHMFVKALLWGARPKDAGNPLENVNEPKVSRRERLLSASELGALIQALDSAAATGSEYPQILGVIRAAIFTGARIKELVTLRWDAVRRDEMELHLQDTKTGFSRRPMSADTLALLESMGRMPGSPYVFRGIENPVKPLDYFLVNKAFRRMVAAAGIEGVSLHMIRHWFATMTANSVSNHRIGMALTGHKSHQAYMTYVHGDKEQARALAEQLAALANGLGKSDANTVDLNSRRRQ